jgi:hypothetical protein
MIIYLMITNSGDSGIFKQLSNMFLRNVTILNQNKQWYLLKP